MRAAVLSLAVFAGAVPAPPAPVARVVLDQGLREPFAVAFDASGLMFIAQMAGNRIGVWDGTSLRQLPTPFSGPHHLLQGPDGAIYVADTGNHMVRRVDPATGEVARFAGTGVKGFGGDGGQALDAQFGAVYAIDIQAGTLYLADLDNRRIRAIDFETRLVRTVAGNGETGVPVDGALATTQPLVDPRAVAVDRDGTIYICERGGHALRAVDKAGRIRTVAGTGQPGFSGDGGPALKASFHGPKHIAIDTDGSVLITDTENHVIRRYLPARRRVERVAGTGEPGASGVGGAPGALQLNRPHGAVRHGKALYISDSDNHRVVAIE